ncbi:MBL fold metallo-hydrolase [Microbispora sp. RL4-1S]|uniref:MBL fold metallo-hydrolase n=1 Tax=Microbispora oryzae TaxID=2806554 RepID=A0A940WK61_9ACTN|nr:MBL fold metallo-hydrolase [Microbispora oryzae]MBP2702651.1 MBL fold metallo-hydrolase [Microbispora oryzae]
MPSNLRTPYEAAPDVFTLPSFLPIAGAGLLPVNAYLIRGPQPILVDTGMAIDRGYFEQALWSLVDPTELRWIVLTHDDRDHAGNLKEVLMAAPQAKLITNGLAVGRLGEEWDVPPNRVVQVNPGRTLDLGGRIISLLRPPAYDSPSTLAPYDHATQALFSADSFGTVLPELADHAKDIPEADYLAGMALFTRANAPWTSLTDPVKFDAVLDEVVRLGARRILSSHGATVVDRVDTLVATMRGVPAMSAWLPEEDARVEAVLAKHEGAAAGAEAA